MAARTRQPRSQLPVVTIRVTVVRKTAQHFRHGMYHNEGYALSVDGGPAVEGRTVEMHANTRYRFETDAPEYPFYLCTHALGGTHKATGRVGESPKPVGRGTLDYVAPAGERATAFFYNCDTRAGMGGVVVLMDATARAVAVRAGGRGGNGEQGGAARAAPRLEVPEHPLPSSEGLTDAPVRCKPIMMRNTPKRSGQFVDGTFIPGGVDDAHVYVCDQVGAVWRVNVLVDVKAPQPFLDVRHLVGKALARNDAAETRGLRSLAFHPNFATNGRLFVYLVTAPLAGRARGRLLEFFIDPALITGAGPDDGAYYDFSVDVRVPRALFEVDDVPGCERAGGVLRFGPNDGLLYLATGDCGGDTDWLVTNVQSARAHAGKVLRLDVDMRAPADADGAAPAEANPLVGVEGASPYVYARGVRDCTALAWDPWCARFLLASPCAEDPHGLDGVHVLERGANYGWPYTDGARAQDTCEEVDDDGAGPSSPPYKYPVLTYKHRATGGIVGAVVYRGGAPPLRRWVVFADASGFIATAPTASPGDSAAAAMQATDPTRRRWSPRRLTDVWARHDTRITTLFEGADGRIFVCTTNKPGVAREAGTNGMFTLRWSMPERTK